MTPTMVEKKIPNEGQIRTEQKTTPEGSGILGQIYDIIAQNGRKRGIITIKTEIDSRIFRNIHKNPDGAFELPTGEKFILKSVGYRRNTYLVEGIEDNSQIIS